MSEMESVLSNRKKRTLTECLDELGLSGFKDLNGNLLIENDSFIQLRSESLNMTDLSVMINEGNRLKGFWDDYDEVCELVNMEQLLQKKDGGGRSFKAYKTALINQFLLLITSEIVEACEALRIDRGCDQADRFILDSMKAGSPEWLDFFEKNIKDSFEDELADAEIRILDLTGGLKIDLWWHVLNKLVYNSTRGKKHNKKF